ncbi:MAG TPA: CoA transferase [Phenylobacterium sp.]|uniref:CaiB/BaiF CoA transferase family protein n=1 Tax=Phenylobacterium sp. TaxID=1871053 RepID=UPI002B4855D1|nr:CoA transferase [Phenylobacterium sp.]HKR90273.1 CoA transferase [Phenylobacterium sp.]HKT54215.1 CoA transferase [Caulobacteraceae bacterium]
MDCIRSDDEAASALSQDAAGRWGALAGLRVLDLTQALAGPFCTQMLADQGADVVKVEPPVTGDLGRTTGAYHAADTEHVNSGYFHSINRNKKSIVVDLKTPEGRDLLLELVPQFDVIVENFRAGVMDRFGLSYEVLRERNPRLVYAAIRGFGDPRSGRSPYSDWPAFDVVAQAMGGISGITGPGPDQPLKIGPGVGDIIPALFLAVGVLSAVISARATGRGQFVDVAMVDAILATSERIVQQWSFGKQNPGPEGNYHPLMSPFGLYPAKDGHVAIATVSQDFFRAFCIALDAPELPEQAEFSSQKARSVCGRRLDHIVSELTRRFTRAELKERLGGLIPFGPVYTIADIVADPHFAAREMLAPIQVPGIPEELYIAGVPIKMSETPGGVHARGPRQGEHTDEVLAAAGFTEGQIAALRRKGAIR